ncbi:MAG: hypothetical protein JXX14_19155 [Deltaproteobacteria bacterium]|nr:hypothetical protein [Deltaproteobacteria bacterium]
MDFSHDSIPSEAPPAPPVTLVQEIERMKGTFDDYRRRARVHIWSSALLWLGIALPVLSSSLLFALGWWGGNDVRVVGILTWLAVVVAIFMTTFILPLKQLRHPTDIARKIGDALPPHRSAIVSANQFISAGGTAHFSGFMLQQHLAHTYKILSSVSPGQVIPLRRLLAPLVLFVLAVLSTMFFSITHRSVIEAGINSLMSDQELPESAVIHERLNPVARDLTLRLKYPEYLGKKDRVLNAFSGGLEAPLGTTVILEAVPLEPDASAGAIDLSDGTHQPLGFLSDGRVAGKFVVDNIEWFSLSLGDERQLIRGPRRSVHVETDRRPTIRLLRPGKALEVDADGDVLVEFEAHDDHGIGRVDLIVRSARDVNVQKTIAHAAPNVTHLRSDYRWNVTSVKLEDVHEVELLVRVYDDDTIAGPKFSNSSAVPVTIMTPKSRQQELIVRQGQILDAMVDLLAGRISTPIPAGKDKMNEVRERFLKLRGETEDVTVSIARLLRRFEEEQRVAPMLKDTWRQIREDLTNQMLFEARLNAVPMAPHKKRLGVDSVTIRLLEKSIAQVDDLILDLQFYTMNESGKLLDQQRRELSELLDLYNRQRSERSRRNILEAMRRMQRTAQYLAEKIGKVRGQVSSVAVSRSMEETVNLNGYFNQIEEALASGDIKKALFAVQKLEHTVAQLMASLEGGHLAFKNERFGKHNQFVDSLLDKLARTEASQLQLRRKTIGVQRQYKEKVLNMMRDEIDGIVKDQVRRVKRMQAAIERIRDPSLTVSSRTADALRNLARRMNDVLKQGDLDRTLEIGDELKTRVQMAKSAAISDKTFGQLDEIEKMTTDAMNRIQESFPNPNRIFNDRDKRIIRTFSFNQRRLTVETRNIGTWVKEQKNDLQFISSQTLQTLKVVSEYMKDGTSALEKRDLTEAAKRQTQALDALTTLRQNLKKSGNTVLIETGVTSESREVFIPGPSEYRVPKKHREDILNAMKAQLPEHYREAIRKYYETLVR